MCRSRAALESTWLMWAVHRRSEVRTRPRCLCILTFFRVLPLRLMAKSEEKGRLVNSIDTVLSTLTANFHSESHVDVASTDLCRWPSHSVGDGLTVIRAVSSANWSQLVVSFPSFSLLPTQGPVISLHYNRKSVDVLVVTVYDKCKHFFFQLTVVFLCFCQCSACICHWFPVCISTAPNPVDDASHCSTVTTLGSKYFNVPVVRIAVFIF